MPGFTIALLLGLAEGAMGLVAAAACGMRQHSRRTSMGKEGGGSEGAPRHSGTGSPPGQWLTRNVPIYLYGPSVLKIIAPAKANS